MSLRDTIKDKKRIVIKVGSSSLQHKETGGLDYTKLDVLVREICNISNQGKDVVLVSSGAIAVGRRVMHISKEEQNAADNSVAVKQACAAIGQARLMMTYQKIFSEYNHTAAQILMTKNTIVDPLNRFNAHNTFSELLNMGVVPIVNENDTVATYEIKFGDNDTLSAIVAALIDADLLILLSDIDGLYSDDPHTNKDAKFISEVEELTDDIMNMGKKSTGSKVGTGGMTTKLQAAHIATKAGADMIIANADDMRIIHRIMDGRDIGTIFQASKDENFYLADYVAEMEY
ncbi:MAG: glutamate 5-kinase [Lachnospiraceae bacterium]|nr:glutamate 5-kinase [Lachnospiraceae bacterium]